jgi:transcriptional regulator of acetoin/glycerol metabolism
MAVNAAKSMRRQKRAHSEFPDIERIPDSDDLKKLELDFLNETDRRIREGMGDLFFDYSNSANFAFGAERYRSNLFRLFVEYFCMSRTLPLKELIENLERTIIIRALSRFNGNQKEVARFLGVKYTTLNEKVKKYNIYFRKAPYKYS